MTLPTSAWTFCGIMTPVYLGLVSKKALLRNPLSAPLLWFSVAAFTASVLNSVVWRIYEAAIMDSSPSLNKIVTFLLDSD